MITTQIARVGPCETIDVIGIPFCMDILHATLGAFAPEQVVPKLCQKMISDGRFGKYTGRGVYVYQNDRSTDDAPEYYRDPTQTHTPGGARVDATGVYERLLFTIYLSILRVTDRGLADLGDMCLGVQRMLDLKADPLEQMRKLGSKGLRDVFDRLRDDLGPRFDCRPVEGTMATLDH